MPLEIGNKWLFRYEHDSPGPTTVDFIMSRITKVTIANGQRYFYCTNFQGMFSEYYPNEYNYWLRFDSTNGVLYRLETGTVTCGKEVGIFNFNAAVGDTQGFCFDERKSRYKCSIIKDTNIFGLPTNYKQYGYSSTNYYCVYAHRDGFVKNIGPVYTYNSTVCRVGHSYTRKIRGCYVNGILYGDTTIPTYAKDTIITNIPVLYSNYPNPFNPNTVIRFSLSVAGMTNLKVYDILGREVATLVNEELKPGTYEVDFDGTNYSSGVYYYRLTAGEFTETRNMVLLR
jgi:hypothetical protein